MRAISVWLAAIVAAMVFALPAAAAPLDTIVRFNAAAGELAEGVAVDKTGRIYVTLAPRGELRAIEQDGSQTTIATFATGVGFGALGLAVDAPGNVFVGVSTFDPATNGVFRVSGSGAVTRLPGTQAIGIPNGLAFDKRGNLYVTDSLLGAVWRISRGGAAELWLQHPLLVGIGGPPVGLPLGANGIAYRHNELLVANTDRGSLVRIPINSDGSAGTPDVFVQDARLGGADGIALDVHGNVYVAVIAQSTIVRVSADGTTLTTLATAADGLDWASSLAFGTGKGNRQTLYVVNFSIGPLFGFPAGAGPALLTLDAGVPGLPLP